MKAPNAAEMRHHERLRGQGCLICQRPASMHHETGSPRHAKCHKIVVPLCPFHHSIQHNAISSRHAMNLTKFNKFWNVDLEAYAKEQWEISERMEKQ